MARHTKTLDTLIDFGSFWIMRSPFVGWGGPLLGRIDHGLQGIDFSFDGVKSCLGGHPFRRIGLPHLLYDFPNGFRYVRNPVDLGDGSILIRRQRAARVKDRKDN